MSAKISVYSLSDLKSTLDDHIPLYLTSPNLGPLSVPLPKPLRFNETHFFTTVRLVLGYTSVAIILYIFYLDYYLKLPWQEHKLVTAWAVLAYAILSAAITAWTWLYERGIVFEGNRTQPSSIALRIYSLLPHRKYDPVYRLRVEWSKDGRNESKEFTSPFTSFFQADGTFVAGEFERWLKSKLPDVLGDDAAQVKEGANTGVLLRTTNESKGEITANIDSEPLHNATGVDATKNREGGKRKNKKPS